MGVRAAIARMAARRAHVLVVETPGGWSIRVALERAVLDRGWALSLSPADADVLAVCGTPGPRLAEAVEQVWQQLPGPRVRMIVQSCEEVKGRLDEVHVNLLNEAQHQRDARDRLSATDLLDEGNGAMDMSGGDDMDMDMDMDMAPGGIPLAGGNGDRDGLEMDVLHVPLGPVLPHWPAGLMVRCALQGDVITEASAEFLGGATDGGGTVPSPSAQRLDNIVALLALAGWEGAAAEARRIRDAVLDDGPTVATRQRLTRLERRVGRSRLLRWSLQGIRPVSGDGARRAGLPPSVVGDTHDRLLTMLSSVEAQLGGDHPTREARGTAVAVEGIAQLMCGLDLATARLVVASLDIHALTAGATDQAVPRA